MKPTPFKSNKILCAACAMLLTITAYSQQKYTVHFTTFKTHPGAHAFIQIGNRNLDTVALGDKTITFIGNVADPCLAQISVDYQGDGNFSHYYPFYLCNGETTMTVNDPGGADSQDIAGNIYAVDYEYKIQRPVSELNGKVQKAIRKYNAALSAHQPDTLKLKAIADHLIFEDFQVPQRYIRANPTSPLCIVALECLGKGDPAAKVNIETLKALFNSLSEEVKRSAPAQAYRKKLENY